MVRLTVELIDNAPQFINTVRERELNLRGYKIPVIENMGVTKVRQALELFLAPCPC